MRDFPLFEGDYFDSSKFSALVSAVRAPATRASRSAVSASESGAAPPLASKQHSMAIAEEVKREVKAHKQKFLVATLRGASASDGAKGGAEPGAAVDASVGANASGAALVDSRMRFLESCRHRHWQFDEPRRAQWATMMLLASLGGRP